MTWLERIRLNSHWNPALYVRFALGGEPVGHLHRRFLGLIETMPDLFQHDQGGVWLGVGDDLLTRTAALDEVVDRLVAAGALPRRRGEYYAVKHHLTGQVLAHIDRGAIGFFGIRAYGVHLNGYIRRRDGLYLWIARRAHDKPVAPGKLDSMVAGGNPVGFSLAENLVKECAEEADMPRDLALQAVPVGCITYKLTHPDVGLRDDVLYVYDLEVPASFMPRNTDGEVERFDLMPAEEVLRRVAETEDFKFNVNLVMIDFAIRHGLIPPDHPDYIDIVRELRQ